MKSFTILVTSFAAAVSTVNAGVVGAAEGFAKGVTGGGNAAPVYPTTNAQLVSYLGDNQARVIILTKTFDFRGSEGTTSSKGCAPWGTGNSCQLAIDRNGWCENYQANAPKVGSITYDKAGMSGITVTSNKSLLGQGSSGKIVGKGLRMSNSKNVILQNLLISDINPHYVWGGDAITLDGTVSISFNNYSRFSYHLLTFHQDMIWIDHVTTQRIARQHIVLGESASGRVSITKCDIDGASSWSATCDGRHYWAIYFTGSNDLVTLKGNYIHHTSGRSPRVQGTKHVLFVLASIH
jgi:pectin lyase